MFRSRDQEVALALIEEANLELLLRRAYLMGYQDALINERRDLIQDQVVAQQELRRGMMRKGKKDEPVMDDD